METELLRASQMTQWVKRYRPHLATRRTKSEMVRKLT